MAPEDSETDHDRPAILDRIEDRREQYEALPLPLRILIVLAGVTCLLAGLAMLVLPGPAFVVIPVGLAILSLEFVWAEALLDRALEQGEIARQKAAQTTRTQRILTFIACVLGGAALVAWALLGDIPVVPV